METNITCTIFGEIETKLSEVEARALVEIAAYGTDNFLKFFYEHLGSYGLKPVESGLVSLFKYAKGPLAEQLKRVDIARKAFNNSANKAVETTGAK